MNPVDEYLKDKEASAQDAKDIEAWKTWKDDPTPQNFQPLMQRFDGLMAQKARIWKAPRVNDAAFKRNMMGHALSAFKSFDPSYGASLRTHVTNRVQKSKRYNVQNQNLAYIPEPKAMLIGKIDAATDELRDDLGREPTHQEVGSAIGKSGKLVKEVQGLRRNDVASASFETDPVSILSPRHDQVVSLLRPALKGDEQHVFDYMYGLNGKPRIASTGDIATKMGKSPSQISRLKKRVEEQYKKYL